MAVLTAKKAEFETIPTGEYLAQVTDIEAEEGNFGPQFKFVFEILKPKAHEGRVKLGWCSQKLTTGSKTSKMWKWVEAIFNRPIQPNEQIDTDDLIGRKVVLVLVAEQGDNGDEISKITSLKPYKQQEPFPVTEAAKADARDEFTAGEPVEDDPFEDE